VFNSFLAQQIKATHGRFVQKAAVVQTFHFLMNLSEYLAHNKSSLIHYMVDIQFLHSLCTLYPPWVDFKRLTIERSMMGVLQAEKL
jgi:hypothetical protein